MDKPRNICATLAYDGKAYLGWQKTIEGPSIQESLERCLNLVLQEKPSIQAASRTDAGVHARGQVINFYTTQHIALNKLHLALNSLLPPDISVLSLKEADPLFHPSLDSKEKEYHYYICTHPIQPPTRRFFSWHFYYPLNIETMQRAAKHLIGTHNFTAFCNLKFKQPTNCICTLTDIKIKRENPEQIKIVIKGNRFLYKMVRNIVGTLAYIGCNKLPTTCALELLRKKDRTLLGMTAPAHGLFLHKISFL